jgi:GDPmannose 4,6-dehydratase
VRVLITGATGQDGSYLAELLAADGHDVFAMVRGQWNPRQEWLGALAPGIQVLRGDLLDLQSLIDCVSEANPDVVYNLAGVSSPGLAWREPELAAQVTGVGVLRLLQAVQAAAGAAVVVQASSIAVHGPYGAAKLYASAICRDYRERGLHVSEAVFGGHHSPRRTPDFLSRKVTMAVARAEADDCDRLRLGPLTRSQDWGAAPDFVRALREIAEGQGPGAFDVSTGDPHTSAEFVELAYAAVGLDWREHVVFDDTFAQPTDVASLSAAPDQRLRWRPEMPFGELVRWLVREDVDAMTEGLAFAGSRRWNL